MQVTAIQIDLLILVLIALSFIIGLMRGLIREVLSLATWVAALAFALLYVKPLADQIPFSLQSDIARLGLAFTLIFLSVMVIGSIISHLLSTAISAAGLGSLNHILGGLFGLLRGFLIIIMLIILLELTPIPRQVGWKESLMVPWFEKQTEYLKTLIPDRFADYLERAPS